MWPCGVEAALALGKVLTLNQSSLQCSPWSKDGRSAPDPPPATTVEVCEVGDEDLAVLMLHNGHALALPGAFPDYVDAERQARDAKLAFGTATSSRRGTGAPAFSRRAGAATRPGSARSRADRQRLYDVPTDPEYQAITIDPKQGETIFCSDEAARQAGWRHIGETASVGQ